LIGEVIFSGQGEVRWGGCGKFYRQIHHVFFTRNSEEKKQLLMRIKHRQKI
jgi:hypothetical protein